MVSSAINYIYCSVSTPNTISWNTLLEEIASKKSLVFESKTSNFSVFTKMVYTLICLNIETLKTFVLISFFIHQKFSKNRHALPWLIQNILIINDSSFNPCMLRLQITSNHLQSLLGYSFLNCFKILHFFTKYFARKYNLSCLIVSYFCTFFSIKSNLCHSSKVKQDLFEFHVWGLWVW